MEQVKLKDGTIIDIVGATSMSISIESPTRENFDIAYDLLTENNLSEYEILTENGSLNAKYKDRKVIESGIKDGVATFLFGMVDTTAKRVEELEESNYMLTECILEMSQIVYAS